MFVITLLTDVVELYDTSSTELEFAFVAAISLVIAIKSKAGNRFREAILLLYVD